MTYHRRRYMTTTPNAECLCEGCLRPLGVWHNGGYLHPRCAAEHERVILGTDPDPGLLADLEARCSRFLTRLAVEGEALGIDPALLRLAVERAVETPQGASTC